LRQRYQLTVGPAAVQSRKGVVQLAPHGPAMSLLLGRSEKWWLPGQDHAQDGAQAEHVSPLVEALDLAAGLLGGHVGGRPQHAAHLRGWLLGSGPYTEDRAGLLGRPCWRGGLVGICGEELGESPVHDLHFAEDPDHDVARLEVAVNHPLTVGIRDRLAYLP